MIISKHARKRIKERCGVSKRGVERFCALADERGIDISETKGTLRKWLEARCSEGTIKVYGDKAFIISENSVLITVLQIPAELTKNKNKMFCSAA